MVTGDFYDQIENWIVTGAVDCGFLRLPSVKRLQTYALHRDELQVIVPCDHPYAGSDPFPREQLASEPFIQLEEGDDYLTIPSQVNCFIEKLFVLPETLRCFPQRFAHMSQRETSYQQ